jgi:anaerobic magnesium-protoporphyrin IX monomethyl ester cyclase
MSAPFGVDLLLVNPSNRRQIYQVLSNSLTAIEPPVWAGLIASYARGKGFSVQVLDAEGEVIPLQETVRRIVEMRPRLTAIVVYGHQPSASTQNMTAAGATCTALKEAAPELTVTMVGGHVAALPERTLNEEQVDYVCGGEGLYTIAALLEALKSSRPDDVTNVPDLWYRTEDGVPAYTKPAPLLKDLDGEMPGIAWDLLPMHKYRAHNWHCFGGIPREPYAAIYTTLGCPYRCTFCCIQAPFKSGELALGMKEEVNSYRFWSPDAVIGWIDVLVQQYGVKNIKIADEMFVLHPKHVHGICDRIIERGYDLNIWAYARVDTVREGMLDKLKAAGFNWLAFGIEAANDRVRNDVQKGFGAELMFKTIERVKASDINIIGNYIFGLPEDDFETMQETLDLALSLNTEFGNFYSAMAYPGSDLYQHALRAGWPLPDTWSGYSQHAVNTLPLPTNYVSGGEVLGFRDHAFDVYFNSPTYQAMIERKFGAETLAHIREMCSHTLERRYAVPYRPRVTAPAD